MIVSTEMSSLTTIAKNKVTERLSLLKIAVKSPTKTNEIRDVKV